MSENVAKTQMVSFNVMIEVDVAGWALTYGLEGKASEIRDDVRSSILNAVQQCGHGDGAVKSVTPRWAR